MGIGIFLEYSILKAAVPLHKQPTQLQKGQRAHQVQPTMRKEQTYSHRWYTSQYLKGCS